MIYVRQSITTGNTYKCTITVMAMYHTVVTPAPSNLCHTRRICCPYSLLISMARSAEAITAFMRAQRTPAFSSSCTPAMVVPPGDVTMSLRAPGCFPVSSTIIALPITV
mmetsp:Transcript_957/g.1494  ORF Transcript_957/g.1494 Transcript_957/m.1494 type:complete len:109 (-) Transcript_957:883-1209(-)